MSSTNSSRSNPAAHRGHAAVNTTTPPAVSSVQLSSIQTARGRRRVSNTGRVRGPPSRVDYIPRDPAPEPCSPRPDNLSSTSSTGSAASGDVSSHITPHSSQRRSNRSHVEHRYVPLTSVSVGNSTFRPAIPRPPTARTITDVSSRPFTLSDGTVFGIDPEQTTYWRWTGPTDVCIHGTTDMAPFSIPLFYDAEGQPINFNVVPSPSRTSPSGHPKARAVRNILEALTIAYALYGHTGMVHDYCGSGRAGHPRVHVSLPVFGPRDLTRKQTDRRFQHMSTCQHREVCDCHTYEIVVCVDTLYYMSVETVTLLINSCKRRKLIAVHHLTNVETETEISFRPVGDCETICTVPEVAAPPATYRHSTLWDVCPPQFTRTVLLRIGSHAICEYVINDDFRPSPPTPIVLPVTPPAPSPPPASPVATQPDERPRFVDDKRLASTGAVGPVSPDQYGWQETLCQFPKHQFVFGNRYVIRNLGDVVVVQLPLPTRFIDSAAGFPVSTDAKTSYSTFTAKCRSHFMAKLQSHADSLDGSFPIEAVFTQLVVRAYRRAIEAAASATALQRTPEFFAHVSQDEIIATPSVSWKAYLLSFVAPYLDVDFASASRRLLARIPPPCYVLALFGLRQYVTSPPSTPVSSRSSLSGPARRDNSPISVQAVALGLLMVGSTVLSRTYRYLRPDHTITDDRPRVIPGQSDKAAMMHNEVHSFGPCDSAQEVDASFPALAERNNGQRAVTMREEVDRKVDPTLAEPMKFRSVGPVHAIGHSYGGSRHNTLVALKRRCEDACLPRVASSVEDLASLMLMFAKRCPVVGDDFKIKTHFEWSRNSSYSQSKIATLDKARAAVDNDPMLPYSNLDFRAFIKTEVVFHKTDLRFVEAEPAGGPDGKPRIVSSLDPTVQVEIGPSIASLSDALSTHFSPACPIFMYLCASNQQVGAWLKRCELVCSPFFFEGDASNFDFSQCREIRCAVVAVYRRLGLPYSATKLLETIAKSKVYRFGAANITLKTTGTNASGANDTTISNNIVNLCTIVCCVAHCIPDRDTRDHFIDRFIASIGKTFDEVGKPPICAVIGGDDNVFVVAPEYQHYLTAEKLSEFSTNIGIKYNFISRRNALETTFVSGLFMPALMRRSIYDNQQRCILDISDSGADTYVLIATPGRIVRKLGWTTVPASTISDVDLPKHLGEKAYGILTATQVYVPFLSDYLSLIASKYHDRSYSSDPSGEFHRSMRYGKRSDPDPCLVDNDHSRDIAWAWFQERYDLDENDVKAFLSVVTDRLSPNTTQTSWYLPHDVTNIVFAIDCG